jgi:hypothetical protein
VSRLHKLEQQNFRRESEQSIKSLSQSVPSFVENGWKQLLIFRHMQCYKTDCSLCWTELTDLDQKQIWFTGFSAKDPILKEATQRFHEHYQLKCIKRDLEILTYLNSNLEIMDKKDELDSEIRQANTTTEQE